VASGSIGFDSELPSTRGSGTKGRGRDRDAVTTPVGDTAGEVGLLLVPMGIVLSATQGDA